jgi:hemoglobin
MAKDEPNGKTILPKPRCAKDASSFEFNEPTTSERSGAPAMSAKSLYERLGGYDAISAVSNDLVDRLQADPQLGRFWQHRGEDGLKRERQLLVDFLCAASGGPMYYTGRDMKLSHQGMRISESDWDIFLKHAAATLDKFKVLQPERDEVVAFVLSTKADIVEV